VWQQPIDEVLAASLPIVPLAPVSRVAAEKVPDVLGAISERLIRETSPEQAATIWTATKVLMGLRYSIEQVEDMVRGISTMILGIRGIEESLVYQDIFAKGEAKGLVDGRADGLIAGRIEEARQAVLQVGRKKLNQPDEEVRKRIAAIDNVDRLNALLERILDVSSWDELLTFSDPPA
jgi:predicted transposase YdaD